MKREIQEIKKVNKKKKSSINKKKISISKDDFQGNVKQDKQTIEKLNDGTREVQEITEVKKSKKINAKNVIATIITIAGTVIAGVGIANTLGALLTKVSPIDPYMAISAMKREAAIQDGLTVLAMSLLPLSIGYLMHPEKKQSSEYIGKPFKKGDDYALNVAMNHFNGTPNTPAVNCDYYTNNRVSELIKNHPESQIERLEGLTQPEGMKGMKGL